MSKLGHGLTPQQQEQLLSAANELSRNWGFDSSLEEFKRMYFYSQADDWYDHKESRVAAQNAFRHLHDFLSTASMVFEKKEGCHLLAVS